MTLRLIPVLLALAVLGGCGAKEDSMAAETKPAEVKLDMPKADQDALAARVGEWDPKKDSKK